jgi:hypothetical protein
VIQIASVKSQRLIELARLLGEAGLFQQTLRTLTRIHCPKHPPSDTDDGYDNKKDNDEFDVQSPHFFPDTKP